MKKILITGSTGCIGRNFLEAISQNENYESLIYTRTTPDEILVSFIKEADYVVHLAGVSRPQDPKEFYKGNSDLTKKIIDTLIANDRTTPIIFTSSIHASMDNDFGKSKRLAEEAIFEYEKSTGAKVCVIRLTNVFGKWAKPNTHSVIATFCYNISHNLDITISDPSREITLAYVDDVVHSFINIIDEKPDDNLKKLDQPYYSTTKTYTKSLNTIAKTLYDFKNKGTLEKITNDFNKKLYLTYEAYEKMK